MPLDPLFAALQQGPRITRDLAGAGCHGAAPRHLWGNKLFFLPGLYEVALHRKAAFYGASNWPCYA